MRFTSPAEKRWFDAALDHWQRRVEGAERDVLARILYQRYAETKAQLLHKAGFDPDQPRDEYGRWTDGDESAEGGQEAARDADRTSPFFAPRQAPETPPRDSFGEAPDGTPIEAAQADSRRHSSSPIDLREEEGDKGAHTIGEHVGKSEYYLAQKLRDSVQQIGNIIGFDRASGSFSSVESGNKLVNSTLSESEGLVERVARGEIRSFVFLEKTFGSITEYEAYWYTTRQQPQFRQTNAVRVVIVHDPTLARGFRVHTAFPIFK